MTSIELQTDVILLAYSPPFRVDADRWLLVRDRLQARIGARVLLLDMQLPDEELEGVCELHWGRCREWNATRVCLISIDCHERARNLVQETGIWGELDLAQLAVPPVYVAPRWSARDWADLIASRMDRFGDRKVLLLTDRLDTEVSRSTDRVRVPDIVWELRTRELDADFAFALREAQDQVHLVSWVDSRTDQAKELSFEYESNIELEHIVPILVAKYLSAFTEGTILHQRSSASEKQDQQAAYDDLQRKMDALLPTEYRGRTDTVSPNSMGSASLYLDESGQVPWDKIWTSFCDLALAGGPPHRGKLLEAVTREEAAGSMEAYEQVVDEIRRGIRLSSGLITFESEVPGWVGIECDDESMATWMLRAIITENVMVRREGKNLFVPAGPSFRLKREIKNVITSVAKTAHYWNHHRRNSQ